MQSNEETRLWVLVQLARRALIATGYYLPHEVSDDIAPRITELWSRGKHRIPLGDESIVAMEEIDRQIAERLMVADSPLIVAG